MSDTVTPVSGASYFGETAATKKSTLDMTTFLNLLVTQLQNQNPLQPMDDSAFYGQIAQLGQVQGLSKLNSSADLSQAQELLGKTVTAARPTTSTSGKQGEVFTGVVQSIAFKNGSQYLNVQEDGNGGTVQIQISGIQSVLPTVDVASMSGLIGKYAGATVTVNDKPENVFGTIVGISAENGQAIAQVKDSDGTLHSIPVSSLGQISTTVS